MTLMGASLTLMTTVFFSALGFLGRPGRGA
jgi:hypothetical protein